uniref:Uncharacterized protein n=1 Tax=uncultured marine virus TaxID=186617 RepID=S4TDP3_9VIRU|nr:hypothetical protein [uncultured marine virus]
MTTWARVMARTKARRISKPQPEHSVMLFEATNANNVIDLAAALTAVNRKQYHQTKNYKPLAYHFRAQCLTLGSDSDPVVFSAAPNTWTTRNAVMMLGNMYRKHLSNNNITRSMLGKYGKEIRMGFGTGFGYSHGSGTDGFSGSASLASSGSGQVLFPVQWTGSEVFANYTNTDGTAVTKYTANDLTLVSIPEAAADGEPETVVFALTGTSDHDANDFAVIDEYLKSRRNISDHEEIDATLPDDTSLMLRIGSTADEHFDDVVDALEETGDQRPYDIASADTDLPVGMLASAGDYTSGVAPLGLLKVSGNSDSKYFITVTAITEM